MTIVRVRFCGPFDQLRVIVRALTTLTRSCPSFEACRKFWAYLPVLVGNLIRLAVDVNKRPRVPVPVGNLIRLASEAESRNVSGL